MVSPPSLLTLADSSPDRPRTSHRPPKSSHRSPSQRPANAPSTPASPFESKTWGTGAQFPGPAPSVPFQHIPPPPPPLPNYLKPPSGGQGTPLHQPDWKRPRLLPAGSAECREECGAAQLTRALEPCPGRLPAPARSAGPRAVAGGAATEPARLGSEPPRRLLTPPLGRSLSSRG